MTETLQEMKNAVCAFLTDYHPGMYCESSATLSTIFIRDEYAQRISGMLLMLGCRTLQHITASGGIEHEFVYGGYTVATIPIPAYPAADSCIYVLGFYESFLLSR